MCKQCDINHHLALGPGMAVPALPGKALVSAYSVTGHHTIFGEEIQCPPMHYTRACPLLQLPDNWGKGREDSGEGGHATTWGITVLQCQKWRHYQTTICTSWSHVVEFGGSLGPCTCAHCTSFQRQDCMVCSNRPKVYNINYNICCHQSSSATSAKHSMLAGKLFQ